MADTFITTTGPIRIRRGPRGPAGVAGATGPAGADGSSGSGTIANTGNLIKGDGAGAGIDSGVAATDVTTLQTDLATAEGNITTLQTDLDAAEATIVILQSDLDTAEAAITAFETSDPLSIPVNTGGWTEYIVTTNDAYTGQTLQDIAELVSDTLSAGARYELEAKLMFSMSADATGMRVAVHGGGGGSAATALIMVSATSNNQSNANTFVIPNVDVSSSSTILAATSVLGIVVLRGFVTTRSGGTPTISLQHLKVTSGTSTCLPGSTMRLRKCAA